MRCPIRRIGESFEATKQKKIVVKVFSKYLFGYVCVRNSLSVSFYLFVLTPHLLCRRTLRFTTHSSFICLPFFPRSSSFSPLSLLDWPPLPLATSNCLFVLIRETLLVLQSWRWHSREVEECHQRVPSEKSEAAPAAGPPWWRRHSWGEDHWFVGWLSSPRLPPTAPAHLVMNQTLQGNTLTQVNPAPNQN